ncbi:uncharacterized protein BJX67DRAFT_167848 [Aspergillus lucknowensis]|uniref:Uncharacterized protein n=1 Tax=Aspergillus lucknowensis TaxID=176173 RepID=A0ABR4M542_9EURO
MARIKDRCYPLIYRFVMADEPEPMKLDELEIQGVPDDFVTENWIRTFDFHSIRRLTLIHRHFYFDEGATEFWTYLRESKISFKMIKTDCENEPLDQFISSFEGLEALYLLDYDKRWSTLSSVQFAGHFHSLRRFFYPNNIHGMSFYSHNVLRSIIANCPLLEELGMYIEGEGSIEATFKVLDESPCLKRLYITCATRGEGDYSSYPYFNHDEFLEIFFAYFAYSRPVESAFLNRLEVLSYYRTLWEIVPIDLDDSEFADMQEELNYEPLSDGELEDLIQDHKPAENELYVREKEKIDWPGGAETAEEGSEDNSDGHDYDFSWVTQPSCYTWERAAHGFNRVPLRVSWMDYRGDELAWTVYQWVLGEDGVFKRGLFRKPPWLDDWADESDVGMDGYGVPREESEEEEEEEENTDQANEVGEEEEGADEEGD